jgi:hypothetical protein
MVDPLLRDMVAASILSSDLRDFVVGLDEIDTTCLAHAIYEAHLGPSPLCCERNRIPLRFGPDMVLYQLIHTPVQCEIATLEYNAASGVGAVEHWPTVVDFTLPARWNIASRVQFSNRADMPIYSNMRKLIRAEIEFIHV